MDKQAEHNIGASDYFDRGLFLPSEIFHENSKMRSTHQGYIFASYETRPSDEMLHLAATRAYRIYRTAKSIPLPKYLAPLPNMLEEVLRSRRSVREYSGAPVSLEHLSRILELSYGIIGEKQLEDGTTTLSRRATPSAGGLYPIEIYPVILCSDEIAVGLYHYQTKDHTIDCLQARELRDDLKSSILYPEIVSQASVVFLLAAIFQRTRFKYGERGYRFIHLDAGHVAQNIYLVSSALGLGAVAIGGFLDDALNQLLEMNGVDEAVIYTMALGHPLT